jgi:tellurite resistance protein
VAEVLYTVRLQLRLVCDLHLLYGIPLDASDPEDLLGIFAVVYGVKIAEIGGIGTKALGPEVMRAQLYRLIHGNTKAIQATVNRVLGPRIARSVTQKGILKTAVPVVGVALSAGWNYTATRTMGSRVRQEVRIKAALREEARRLQARVSSDQATALALVEGLLALALADGDFDDLEREVYLTFLKQLQLSEEQLERLAGRIHADLEGVLSQLGLIGDQGSREAIAHCLCLIAAADGELKPAEQQTLARLLDALGQAEQLQQAEQMCDRFPMETGVMGQAMGAVGDAVGNAAVSATEAMGSALGWVKGRLRRQDPSGDPASDAELEAGPAEQEMERVPQEMAELDRQLAAGTISLKAYREQWSQLEQRMQNRPSAQTP